MSKKNNKKEYDPKPTLNQKRAFQEIIKKVKKGEKINIGEAMRKAGYSEATSKHPEKLLDAKGFRKLMDDLIDDKTIIKRFLEILEKGRARESLKAGKELLKLKDRYPSKKHKIDISKSQEELIE